MRFQLCHRFKFTVFCAASIYTDCRKSKLIDGLWWVEIEGYANLKYTD